jgi:hypothetical protein
MSGPLEHSNELAFKRGISCVAEQLLCGNQRGDNELFDLVP